MTTLRDINVLTKYDNPPYMYLTYLQTTVAVVPNRFLLRNSDTMIRIDILVGCAAYGNG